MSRGKKLSDCEQQRIIDLKSCGKTQREIANIIGRSQNVIGNFLRAGCNVPDITYRPVFILKTCQLFTFPSIFYL